MTDLSHEIGGLSADQLALLQARLQRLRRQGGGEGSGRRIVRRERRDDGGEAGAPLSFQQEQLWFLDQLDPGSPAYNQPSAIRLTGALDRGALSRALTEIVRRHEALRTCFRGEAGRPVQVVAPPVPFPLPQIDLSAVPAAARPAALRSLLRDRARRPMDLERGRLIRAALVPSGSPLTTSHWITTAPTALAAESAAGEHEP